MISEDLWTVFGIFTDGTFCGRNNGNEKLFLMKEISPRDVMLFELGAEFYEQEYYDDKVPVPLYGIIVLQC